MKTTDVEFDTFNKTETMQTVQEYIDTLESRLALAVEALQFYANYMNYSIDYDTSGMGFSRRCILYGDIEERNPETGLAGMRARQALAKIRGEG